MYCCLDAVIVLMPLPFGFSFASVPYRVFYIDEVNMVLAQSGNQLLHVCVHVVYTTSVYVVSQTDEVLSTAHTYRFLFIAVREARGSVKQ